MASSDFTQIPVGPNAIQVCPPLGEGETVTLYNQDINNIVYVGRAPNFSINSGIAAPIQPLTSAVLPASRALYAVALAGTAQLIVIPEGGTLSPSPAQIATQIAALGLAKDTSVNNPSYGPVPLSYAPAKDSTVSQVNTTLGTPAQHLDVITTLPTNIANTGVTSRVPQTINNIAAFGAGASWGPSTFTFAGAAAYLLALTPTVAANSCATDIFIEHLDVNSNVVYTEFFGAIPCGVWPPAGTSSVTIIRGNLHGVSLRIRGQSAAQAFVTALNVGVQTVTGGSIIVYSLAQPIVAGAPKIQVAYGGNQNLSQGIVWSNGILGLNTAAGATNNQGLAAIYAGPVVTDMRFTGALSSPVNARVILSFFSVAGGSATAIMIMRVMSPTIGLETYQQLNFPAALCQVAYANTDATTAAQMFFNAVAQNQA